jgi:hypothetical protein
MAAAITLLGSSFNTTSGTHTVTATPAVGDLIVIVTIATGSVATTACTDNNGSGTYNVICSPVKASSADTMTIQVRTAAIASATSTVFTCAPGTTTGGGIAVYKVTGISRVGSNAIRQSAIQSNQSSGGTPTPVFGFAALTTSAVIGAVFNATSSATLTPRSSPSYTEDVDTGYSTPTTGIETMHVNSGETGTNIAWGSTSGSAFCSAVVEIDSTAQTNTTPTPRATEAAAMSIVARVGDTADGGDTTLAAPAFDSTHVNLIVVAVVAQPILFVKDNIDSSAPYTGGTVIGSELQIFYRFIAPGAGIPGTVVTCSYNGTVTFRRIMVWALSNALVGPVIDGTPVGATGADTGTTATAAITCASGNGAILAAVCNHGGTTVWTASNGFSLSFGAGGTLNGNTRHDANGIEKLAATGSQTPQLTYTAGSTWSMSAIAFAGGGLTITGYAPVVTVASVSVTPGKQTLAITAKTPNTRLGLIPAIQSLTLSTKTPNTRFGLIPGKQTLAITALAPIKRLGLVPAIQALTVTGRAPSLILRVTPGVQALTLTPQAPVKRLGVIPGQQALTITPQTPAKRLGVIPGQQTLATTGRTPNARLGVVPAIQALTLTPKTPVQRLGVVPGNQGMAITAKTPTLAAAFGVSPGHATLAITAFAPSLRIALNLPAPPALAAAAHAPTERLGVVPGVASVAITGRAPSLTLAVAVPKGTLALTAHAPIRRTAVVPGTASLAITGIAPSLKLNLNLGTAALTVTLKTATVRIGVIPGKSALTTTTTAGRLALGVLANKGTIAITGAQPVVNGSSTVFADPASRAISITGFAPSLRTFLAIPKGALSITGFAPLIGLGVKPTAAGPVHVTGLAPTLRFTTRVFPGQQALVVSPVAPLLSFRTSVQPTVAAIRVIGLATGIGFGRLPGTGAVVITGRVPAVSTAMISFRPAVGQLIFAGRPPLLNVTIPIGIDVRSASLALNTTAPHMLLQSRGDAEVLVTGGNRQVDNSWTGDSKVVT